MPPNNNTSMTTIDIDDKNTSSSLFDNDNNSTRTTTTTKDDDDHNIYMKRQRKNKLRKQQRLRRTTMNHDFLQAMIIIAIFAVLLIYHNYTRFTTPAPPPSSDENINIINAYHLSSSSSTLNTFLSSHLKPLTLPSSPRTLPIHTTPASSKVITVIHIAKCAGTSLLRHLRPHIPTQLRPVKDAGEEYSLPHSLKQYPRTTSVLMMFKSPRRHLWSLFAQCKYSSWGKTEVADGARRPITFPNDGGGYNPHGPNNETDVYDFEVWLRHFVEGSDKLDAYHCYHASNFQSRAVATHNQNVNYVNAEWELVPGWEGVKSSVETKVNWVGLTEFYHESLCLLSYRASLGGTTGENATTTWAEDYLEQYCRCPIPTTLKTEVHVHHVEGHRSTFSTLDPAILYLMERLTTVDTKLYEYSLYKFLSEMVWLETHLGRRVLCDKALESQEVELEYVLRESPVKSVKGIYWAMKEYNERELLFYG